MEIASPFDDFIHIIEADKDKPIDKQRRLTGRYPTVREKAVLSDMRSQLADGGYALNTGSTNLMAVHLCISKMENFFDRKGNQIILERDINSNEFLPNGKKPWNEAAFDYIPEIDFLRFAIKIKDGGNLDEAELKNLPSSPDDTSEK